MLRSEAQEASECIRDMEGVAQDLGLSVCHPYNRTLEDDESTNVLPIVDTQNISKPCMALGYYTIIPKVSVQDIRYFRPCRIFSIYRRSKH